jgi:class 3 adenylate cyclase
MGAAKGITHLLSRPIAKKELCGKLELSNLNSGLMGAGFQMWQVVVHSPEKEPKRIELKPGKLTLGRAATNALVIDDISASRQHAEIIFDSTANTVTLVDLKSLNGTFLNHQRIDGAQRLKHEDLVRIGQVILHLTQTTSEVALARPTRGTHHFTRELVLASLDEHSVLIYEIARKLNTVLNLEEALEVVTEQLKRALGVEVCEILLAKQLKELETSDFIDPLAKEAVRNCSAELTSTSMFIPIVNGNELIGLISLQKTRLETHPFGQHDLQLAVAISYQASLTIQRMELLEIVRREEQTKRLLLRFVSPAETEFLLKDYFENGELPGLREQKVTVLFSDIAHSTGLAEKLGVAQFGNILNSFYNEATRIIFQHNGMIKYLGDGVLAIFTEQAGGLSTEEKAVLAGRELLNLIKRTGALDPDQRIVIGVAINTGLAMVGYVGTRERAEFNVIGDTVNVAYRMQEYARPYKIIVGPATVAAVSSKYRFQRVGAVSLRGREQTVQAYEVLPEGGLPIVT